MRSSKGLNPSLSILYCSFILSPKNYFAAKPYWFGRKVVFCYAQLLSWSPEEERFILIPTSPGWCWKGMTDRLNDVTELSQLKPLLVLAKVLSLRYHSSWKDLKRPLVEKFGVLWVKPRASATNCKLELNTNSTFVWNRRSLSIVLGNVFLRTSGFSQDQALLHLDLPHLSPLFWDYITTVNIRTINAGATLPAEDSYRVYTTIRDVLVNISGWRFIVPGCVLLCCAGEM